MHRNSGVTLLIVWLSLLTGLKHGQAESICAFYDKSFPLSNFVDTKDTDTDNAVKSYEGETSSKEMEKVSFGGEILPDNKTIRCLEDKTFCYTLWSADAHNKTQITIIKQGCWIGEEACTNVNCLSKTEPKPIPPSNSSQESKFCCCSSNMCNENVTDVYVPGLHTTAIPVFPEFDQNYRERTIIISLVSVCSVALVTIVVYFLYRVLVTSKRVSMDSLNIMEAAPPPNITLEDLKLSCNVNRGRYSEVWKGLLNDQEVAVKIYPANYKQHYLNERSIYSLPFMEHENLLQFYGSDERLSQEGSMQYMLIFNYIPIGSLSGYLKHNTVDWSTLCKMCISFTRGLAHLHNDITKGDKVKSAVAHRDFNSRNILVSADMSCIVADLGFSMSTMGSKLIKNGHAENAEQKSLTDVGTLRYMAPELLDGAVNLRDCEASLKQIDIYSLGLVLWEVATRCSDLYQGAPVPEYMLPYQAEAGSHPTFEQLQLLVCRNKVRPKFSEIWKDTNQAVRSLRETMDDCWDADADARLTVLCVEERLSDMIMMWAQDSKHRGMTPTINPTIQQLEKQTINHILPNHTVNEADVQTTENHINSPPTDSSIPLLSQGHHDISTTSHNYNWYQDLSGSTTETVIPITPVELEQLPVKANNITKVRNSVALKPHQGRNPIVARNTHKCSDEELAVSGNRLINSTNHGDSSSGEGNIALQENLFDSVGDNLETSLVQNDVLSHHRNPPIPYLQNQVHGDNISTRPKVANVPGNGVSTHNKAKEGKTFREKLGKLIKPQVLGLKLSHLSIFGKNHKGVKTSDSAKTNQSNHGLLVDETSPLYPMEEDHSNLHRETEVFLQNGQTHTRPTNLALQVIGNQYTESDTDSANVRPHYPESRLGFAEVGVAKLQLSDGPRPSVMRVKSSGQSKSTSDLSPAKTSTKLQETNLGEGNDVRGRRPTSLSLKGSSFSDSNPNSGGSDSIRRSAPNMVHNDHKNSTNSSDKIKKRVKTPVLVNKSRFSLYDDRLMCQSDIVQNNSAVKKLPKTSTSFHQLKAYTNPDLNVNQANIIV